MILFNFSREARYNLQRMKYATASYDNSRELLNFAA